MKNLNRRNLRKILMEEAETVVSESSEMKQFAASKSGKKVKSAGDKIKSAGKSIREIALDQTGKMRSTLGEISSFVFKLGNALSELDGMEDGDTVADLMPSPQDLKKLIKEIQALEK